MMDGMASGCADLGELLAAPFELASAFAEDPKGCLVGGLQFFFVMIVAGLSAVLFEQFFLSFWIPEMVFWGLLIAVGVLSVGSYLTAVLLQRREEKTPGLKTRIGVLGAFSVVSLLAVGFAYMQFQLVIVEGRAHLVKLPSGLDLESRVEISQDPSSWKAALEAPHLRAWLILQYPEKTRGKILGFGSDWWRKMLDKRRTRAWLMKHFPKRAKKELALWKKEAPLHHKLKRLKKAAARVMGDAAKGAARGLWNQVRKVWRRRPPPKR